MTLPAPSSSPVVGQIYEWHARISGTPLLWEVVSVKGSKFTYLCKHPDGRVTGPHTDPTFVLDNAVLRHG